MATNYDGEFAEDDQGIKCWWDAEEEAWYSECEEKHVTQRFKKIIEEHSEFDGWKAYCGHDDCEGLADYLCDYCECYRCEEHNCECESKKCCECGVEIHRDAWDYLDNNTQTYTCQTCWDDGSSKVRAKIDRLHEMGRV